MGGNDPFGALKTRFMEAGFPVLAANLRDRKTKRKKLPPLTGAGAKGAK